MAENRFAGLSAEALDGAERKALVRLALEVMATALATGPVMDGSATVKEYLRLKVGDSEREQFGCLFLNTRHEVLSDQVLFEGTIDRTKVYPREILKRIFALNAAAVIVYQNHPSGTVSPGGEDLSLTSRLRGLFEEVDVRLLDHVIVSAKDATSMADEGYIQPA